MVDKKDQDYPFIKETIKERPIDKKTVLRRLAMAASCGIVFGICAVVTVMAFVPNIFRQFEKEAKKAGDGTVITACRLRIRQRNGYTDGGKCSAGRGGRCRFSRPFEKCV